MKLLKKVLAFSLIAVMLFAMTGAAFADANTEHTITITNSDSSQQHTYVAYQVFVGTVEEDQLTKIAWGSGVDGEALLTALKEDTTIGSAFTSAESASDVAKALEGFADDSDALDAFALLVGQNLATVAGTSTQTDNGYTISVTGDGYYFVKDKDNTVTAEGESYTKYMLKVIENATIEAKDDHLTPVKKIVDGEERLDATSAAIGDEITFEITIPVPKMNGYQNYFFQMNDVLCKGLTFKEIKSVKVGSTTLTLKSEAAEGDTKTYTYTTTAGEGGTTKLDLTYDDFIQYKGTTGNVVVQYSAILNEDAELTKANENTVKYTYSNDPAHSGDGEYDDVVGTTVEDTTETFVTQLKLIKIGDSDPDNKLEGAQFQLTGDALNIVLLTGEKFEKAPYTAQTGETVADGTYYLLKDGTYTTTAKTDLTADQYAAGDDTYVKVSFSKVKTESATVDVVAVTDSKGEISFVGLNAGEYTLKELVAPHGYNKIADTTFTIVWTKDDGFAVKEGDNAGLTYDKDTNTFSITVDNKSGSTLPSTGGIGTTIFYIAGSLCVLVAGVLLIAKRRASSN